MDLEGYEEFKSPINSSAFVYLGKCACRMCTGGE